MMALIRPYPVDAPASDKSVFAALKGGVWGTGVFLLEVSAPSTRCITFLACP